jgi:mono/diheme cytochrome c family protein
VPLVTLLLLLSAVPPRVAFEAPLRVERGAPLGAAATQSSSVTLQDGEQIFRAACAACHGPDGRGQPRSTVGFDTPLPDFTDCSFATPETAADWMVIAHPGGPVRAFDRRMPAFGEVLSDEQIERAITYVRGLCTDRAWPRGELNLPRALVTEKAFPENETVLTTAIAGGEAAVFENVLLYEQRLGARSQFEVAVPLAVQKNSAGEWQRGLGDLAVALKHALFHSLESGTIVSAAAEVVLPTGKETQELGTGVTIFEPFIAVGQILPSDGFLQFQGGMALSTNRSRASNEAFWRVALGKTFTEGRFGRSWSPMVELVAARELGGDKGAEWDVVPQVQVSLSKRQHILFSAGVRIPVTDRRERTTQVLTYLLWDWFDGGLLDGWR